jgi:hypothetical protein
MRRFAVCLAILCAAFLTHADAATYLVKPDGTGDYPTIQSAMDAASYGDTVLVMPGTYYDCTHLDSHARLCCVLMKSGVCLRGQTGQPADVTIDAQQLGRAISSRFGDPSTIIRDITLTGAWIDGFDLGRWGGGLHCEGSSPLVENCIFTGNGGYSGTAMACWASSPTIRNCRFIDNDAQGDGAGLIALQGSGPVIEDCLFTGNEAQMDGGALYFSNSSGVVSGCLFAENVAGFWGAGIYAQSSSTLVIRHCTFCLNHCHGDGSGICASSDASLTLEQSIIAFNTGAPGISTLAGGDPASIGVLCCDVYGHPEDNYGGAMLDQTGLNDNISADPCFCDLSNDAFTLWNYSPCAQAGCGTIGAYPVACWDAQEIAGPGAIPAAREGRLGVCASPNPFSLTTSLLLTLSRPGAVHVGIFDMAGREVRSLLVDGAAGEASGLTWDGCDRAGALVPAGVYWVHASQAGRSGVTRVLALR